MDKKNIKAGKEKEKSYIHWTAEMDYALSAALLVQQNLGHKGANGWKGPAFTAAIKALWDECEVHISKEKITARLRTWSKHYQDISAMLDTSGFGWDWDRHVVMVDSEQVWSDYIKAHPFMRHYKDKVIVNWGDLATLRGTDRATGGNATTGVEACNETSVEVEEIPDDDDLAASQPKKKKVKKPSSIDMIAMVVTHIANNIDGPPARERTMVERMYAALAAMPDLSEANLIKAIDMLCTSELKCEIFLVMPELVRRSWLRVQLDKEI
ncbi:hypothetical protein KSP39_PZI004264 [Platanthera zijinensis]|uniref:Myb/SANT-like domain-containing protein n=1 Tax=Platanthera zijinensis TaxID=2320716 RepID=A0AAP0BTQ8_9ASPA